MHNRLLSHVLKRIGYCAKWESVVGNYQSSHTHTVDTKETYKLQIIHPHGRLLMYMPIVAHHTCNITIIVVYNTTEHCTKTPVHRPSILQLQNCKLLPVSPVFLTAHNGWNSTEVSDFKCSELFRPWERSKFERKVRFYGLKGAHLWDMFHKSTNFLHNI